MKDFINVLLILILTLLAILVGYVQYLQPNSIWGLAYLPWFVLALMLGFKLENDY